MRVRVVDASALGALAFGEPKADEINKALQDATMVAPALLWFEVASICLRKMKAHPSEGDQLLKAFALARQLDIKMVEVEHSEVVELAKEADITTYDASYLWVTLQVKGELVTLDEKMRKAAVRRQRSSS
jgi:predicted nucleic acid-binding protein